MIRFDDDLRKAIRRNKLLGMWAAEKLGLKPSTLYTRMKKLKIPNRAEKRTSSSSQSSS